MVDDSYVRAGQVIIDVGINVNAEGKLCGDVDYAAVEPIVDAITPVPGGVGSVTTSVLIGHVVDAKRESKCKEVRQMELREVMQKRKSIRQYLTTPVEEEKVKAMIEAAILAPTWKNAQEIRYYVAVSEEKRQAVLDALGEGNRKKTQNAPVFLISAVILNRAGFQKDGTADNELETAGAITTAVCTI